jgi:hypothetical protein
MTAENVRKKSLIWHRRRKYLTTNLKFMQQYQLTLEQVLQEDGGKRYLIETFPELAPCFKGNKKVSFRSDDKTPSTGVFQHKETKWWMVKDFGAGVNKARTPIQMCMEVNNCGYGQAFKILAKFYGHDVKNVEPSPDYSSRPATPDDHPKEVRIIGYKEFTQAEILLVLSPKAWEGIENNGLSNKDDDKTRFEFAVEIFKYYRFKSATGYEQVSEDGKTVHIYTATPEFPIFVFDEGDFQKIYKPKAEKKYRFLWAGKKPENYIHGLAQHEAYIRNNIAANEKAYNDAITAGQEKPKLDKLPEKLEDITQVSGGSDALNAAALGYRVVWPNSESAKLQKEDYKRIMKIAYTFYNLPDIDIPGREAAKALAFQYIEIKTIWLPAKLSQYTDNRGNPCKDLRDYLKHYDKQAFKKLVKTALPFKFWDEQPAYDKDGHQRWKFGRPLMQYELNHVCTYNFLQMNGFYRYPTDKEKDGYIYIQVEGNKVKTVEPNQIKNFIHTFLRERQMDEDLRNAMYRTQQLNESSLSNLEEFEPDFKHFGKDYQYIFFEKTVWKVTADKIEQVKSPNIHVWDFKVIKLNIPDEKGRINNYDVKIQDDMFRITGNEKDGWRFEALEKNCDFMNFMINTCRIHWRTELEERMNIWQMDVKKRAEYQEANALSDDDMKVLMAYQNEETQKRYKERFKFSLDGELLLEEEIKEQHQAMANRIYSIGYMLHRYKDLAKPWAVFLMDYRISEEGASNGRAGKGLLAKALYKFLEHVWIDGRKQDVLDYQHIWEPVKKWVHDMIHIEDWDAFQPFPRLFGPLTSSLYSNAKGKSIDTYKYEEYGKFWIDTNFADRWTDGSSKGRKLYGVFSDYYHEDLDYYNEVRTPLTELGRLIFDGWDYEQYNLFYNFFAQCLKFYLSVDTKIDPPFSNIQKRNNLAVMGESFRDWANTYFEGKMNECVGRTEAFEDCKVAVNNKAMTSQSFLKKIQAWAEFNGYTYNPEHVEGWRKESERSKYGSIKKNVASTTPGKYTTKEYFYFEQKKDETDKAK